MKTLILLYHFSTRLMNFSKNYWYVSSPLLRSGPHWEAFLETPPRNLDICVLFR